MQYKRHQCRVDVMSRCQWSDPGCLCWATWRHSVCPRRSTKCRSDHILVNEWMNESSWMNHTGGSLPLGGSPELHLYLSQLHVRWSVRARVYDSVVAFTASRDKLQRKRQDDYKQANSRTDFPAARVADIFKRGEHEDDPVIHVVLRSVFNRLEPGTRCVCLCNFTSSCLRDREHDGIESRN